MKDWRTVWAGKPVGWGIAFILSAVSVSPASASSQQPLQRSLAFAQLIDDFYIREIGSDVTYDALANAVASKSLAGSEVKTCFEGTFKRPRAGGMVLPAIRAIAACLAKTGAPPNRVDSIDTEIIAALTTRLDPRSQYMTNAQVRSKYGDEKSDSAIGIRYRRVDAAMEIVSTYPGFPAEKAGLNKGDRITAIDGTSLVSLEDDAFLTKLRGQPTTIVELAVEGANGTRRQVSIERRPLADVDRATVSAKLQGEVLILTIQGFFANSSSWIMEELERAGHGARAVVIDLRGNTGGNLAGAVASADLFLDHGTIAVAHARRARNTSSFKADRNAIFQQIPMAILVDHLTASGAESFAAALRDNQRALIVGEKTAGMGNVRSIMAIPGGVAVLVTETLIRPSGTPIEGVGITADCFILPTRADALELAGQIASEGMNSCPLHHQ